MTRVEYGAPDVNPPGAATGTIGAPIGGIQPLGYNKTDVFPGVTAEQLALPEAAAGIGTSTGQSVEDRLGGWIVADGIDPTGAVDATSIINAALATGKEVHVPFSEGTILVRDTLRYVKGSRFIGNIAGSSANYDEARLRIRFEPPTKRDFIAWDEETIADAEENGEYIFGAAIKGFTVRGFGPGAASLVNLPLAYGLDMQGFNGFAGYDVAMKIDGMMDVQVDHCSFQGFREYGLLALSNATVGYSTTVRFKNSYISQGPTAVYATQNSINSLEFHGTIESVDCTLNQEPGNAIWMDIHQENVPRTDAGGEMFRLGVDGTKSGAKGSFHLRGQQCIGWTAGGPTTYPTDTRFINADYIEVVSIEDVEIQRFSSLLKTTGFTDLVTIANSTSANVPKFAEDGDVFDLARVILEGFVPSSMTMPGQNWFTRQPAHLPTLELPYIDRSTEGFYDNTRFKLYNNRATKKLEYRDLPNNASQVTTLSAASAAAPGFNAGTRLIPGEHVRCSTVGAGYPAGFVSQKYSVNTAVTVSGCSTTSGSPVIAGAGAGHFDDLDVNDYVTVSAGFASATQQFQILAKATNGSTITVGPNATSTVSGTVVVEYPAHDLREAGQQGYRSYAGSPVGVFTPRFVGEELLDTATPKWWKSTGLLPANWV